MGGFDEAEMKEQVSDICTVLVPACASKLPHGRKHCETPSIILSASNGRPDRGHRAGGDNAQTTPTEKYAAWLLTDIQGKEGSEISFPAGWSLCSPTSPYGCRTKVMGEEETTVASNHLLMLYNVRQTSVTTYRRRSSAMITPREVFATA